jgi:hypothetical protein
MATADATQTVRWNLVISEDTNVLVRSFLAQRGAKKGDLSTFVEEAVRLRVLELTLPGERAVTNLADAGQAHAVLSGALLERSRAMGESLRGLEKKTPQAAIKKPIAKKPR